ncbi:DUF4292 domain-containing protein [Labilibacter sediminis]|nr:DUF4292 domain-containing protein [Labilibacter sediminis]
MWKSSVGFVLSFCLFFVSCKSTEKIRIGEVSNITDAKLRNQLKVNELDFDKLYLKKVGFTFTNDQEKKSFKGSFVIQKDSFIIVSIYALMGIELVRAKLTMNNVVIIDKHNKTVLKTDYNYFFDKFGIDLNFSTIQSLLTNSLFLYPSTMDHYDGLKKYKHDVGVDYYSFKSIKDRRLGRLNKKSRNNILIHELKIHPDIYRIFNVYIKDFNTNQSLVIDYKDFSKFDSVLFPKGIFINANQGSKSVSVDLKVNYLQKNSGGSTHFKIPGSYKVKTI